jgi:hypothetical protein
MENPPIIDPPQGAPQLPPQMFTTAAQLLDLTDSTFPSHHRRTREGSMKMCNLSQTVDTYPKKNSSSSSATAANSSASCAHGTNSPTSSSQRQRSGILFLCPSPRPHPPPLLQPLHILPNHNHKLHLLRENSSATSQEEPTSCAARTSF